LARAPLLQGGSRGFEALNAHEEEVDFVVLVFVLVVGPAVAAEQLATAPWTPLHVAAEVVEATRSHAAVVAAAGAVEGSSRWPVGNARKPLVAEVDDHRDARRGEEHLSVAVFADRHVGEHGAGV
jgi:hypothetical protein